MFILNINEKEMFYWLFETNRDHSLLLHHLSQIRTDGKTNIISFSQRYWVKDIPHTYPTDQWSLMSNSRPSQRLSSR